MAAMQHEIPYTVLDSVFVCRLRATLVIFQRCVSIVFGSRDRDIECKCTSLILFADVQYLQVEVKNLNL